ncbi:MAG TPA: NAD-dependent epimerase/dehydratase family protein [Hyphomicrobiaceae bacterium]|nr:NAD-dependent epimerase/dehydratase family protein [Hyphomicrobiaceae bacterium]
MTGTVLVTGASGFVGRYLVPYLAGAGWRVRAAARSIETIPADEDISPVAIPDLASLLDWRPLVDGVSHVVHLAAIAHAAAQVPERAYHDVNAAAVRRLAAAARDVGVRRVVLLSSVRAQSGPSAVGVLNEHIPPHPIDLYGRTKLLGEQWLAETLSDGPTDWVVLRPVLLYGPGVKGNMRTLERLARRPLPLPIGALSGRRSLLGLISLASAILHALTSPAATRATFLVAEPGPLTPPQIVAALRRGLGRSPGVFTIPLGPLRTIMRLTGRSATWERLTGDLLVDTSALERTGWRPLQTAEEGLVRWMREGQDLQP